MSKSFPQNEKETNKSHKVTVNLTEYKGPGAEQTMQANEMEM